MQRHDLERLSREELIVEAERLGVARPRTLTQPELVDEILGRTTKGDRERARVRGWLGLARDLLARVVERGLHLPEAARALRRESEDKGWPAPPPPLPTVTLAEIYAAQGHLERALSVLEEVLTREPAHKEARAMHARFVEQAQRSRSRAARETNPPPIAETSPRPIVVEEQAPATPAVEAAPSPLDEAAKEEAAPEPASPQAVEAAEPEPLAALEDPPLPDRYEVDEIVAIAVDPRTIYLYWEVRATTLAHARAERADGKLAVRVATVVASWEGPIVEARDLPVDALYGDRFVRDVKPGSNVRVSVGWLAGGSFEPFAVGAEVTAPRVTPVESVAQEIARWEAAPVVAAFAHRGAARSAELVPARGREASPPASLVWPRPTGRREGAAPVDTGVMQWSDHAREDDVSASTGVAYETEETVHALDDVLYGALGSSDLVRLPRSRPRTRRVPLPWPAGASELAR